MILDHKFNGILDQGRGHLIIYESTQDDYSFNYGLDIIQNISSTVDVLFSRAKKIGKATI